MSGVTTAAPLEDQGGFLLAIAKIGANEPVGVDLGQQEAFQAAKTSAHQVLDPQLLASGFKIADGVFFNPVIAAAYRPALAQALFPVLNEVYIKDIETLSQGKLKLSIAQGAYVREAIFDIQTGAAGQVLDIKLLINFPSDVCSSNARYAGAITLGLKKAFAASLGFAVDNINVHCYQGGSAPKVEEMNCGSDALNGIFFGMIQSVRTACGGCGLKVAIENKPAGEGAGPQD